MQFKIRLKNYGRVEDGEQLGEWAYFVHRYNPLTEMAEVYAINDDSRLYATEQGALNAAELFCVRTKMLADRRIRDEDDSDEKIIDFTVD